MSVEGAIESGCERFVASALAMSVEQVRSEWQAEGLAGPHNTIDRLLAELLAGTRRRARAGALAEAREDLRRDARLSALGEAFGLSDCERELLALLAAVDHEPRLAAVLGYVENDPRPRSVTLAGAATLFGWEPASGPAPTGGLLRWALATADDAQPWHPDAVWSLDGDISAYLAGREDWHRFWPGLELIATVTEDCLHPTLLTDLSVTVLALAGAPYGIELELVGRRGTGRRTLLTQLCAQLGRPALIVEHPELAVRALRTARILDAVPVWIDPVDVAPVVDERPGALAMVTREQAAERRAGGPVRLSHRLAELTRAQRLDLWSRLTEAPPPASVERWSLSIGELRAAAAAAPAGPAICASQLRRSLGGRAGALLTALECPYRWEDLVVADAVMEHLQTLAAQIRLTEDVLGEWGFSRLTPERSGTTALFAGPSGTGKTMAATILAAELELDLYRVDLSEVVNKYIGETEKRLAQVFDECERSGVVVLFDEADALFGQRTRVRDAHDRFANIEIDYLLTRMDSFDGVAILATNRKSELDTAFLRRIRMIIDFPSPSVGERTRLWRLALPLEGSCGPVSLDLDHDELAAAFDLTGAEIKSVALAAAFLARDAGTQIGWDEVLSAARRELGKRGAAVRERVALNGNGTVR